MSSPQRISMSVHAPRLHLAVQALFCLVLIGLSGCRIPGLYQADPAPPLPDTYNGVVTDENSGQIGIYEFFDDLTLAQLLTDGLAQNQELKIRNQEIYIASNELNAARFAYLPF